MLPRCGEPLGRPEGGLTPCGTWLICQYHLTIPVPNDLAKKVVDIIRGAPEPGPLPSR
jgi:hypothetical protein